MERRQLGHTGLEVSVIGYGCGAIGGLMVKGSAAEQDRAIGRALDQGFTYFDTASAYGDGASERNLGRALRGLGANPVIGTKVRIFPEQRGDIAGTIAASLEASLARLGRERVDIFQLHNPITAAGAAPAFTADAILEQAVPALRRLQTQGKIGHYGITGLGDAPALLRVLEEGGFATAQMPYNLLNPSGVTPPKPGSAMPDLGGVIAGAAALGVGVMAIRVLAGGALSGTEARGPMGVPAPAPIASGADYATDVVAAQRFRPLVAAGFAADLVELALRFAAMPREISTILVGSGSVEEMDHAVAAIARGPLPPEALAMLETL
ncbi:aldo/keto reductase [Roseococcus suduntuyensis]|uniref:Aryl-alcohol dehydrogenase-like predicted oxidoreductase n=1 Tax=Roseococcus suduntuyensis TaxID=455361 RepID=A0A840AC33_9PROT|nr:aldo/keto reductase [Roseococcus suduntuyensis]MBB3897814.1 aryl-alcohol dehydrogenase-like predicted oxidoreductase [Roseococcus suduntuyensis]